MLDKIAVKEDLIGDDPTIRITLLDELPGELPELGATLRYASDGKLKKLFKPFGKKTTSPRGEKAQEEEDRRFRRAFFKELVESLDGVCIGNLCRLSSQLFSARDQVRSTLAEADEPVTSDDQVFEVSEGDLMWIAEYIDGEYFQVISDACANREAFYFSTIQKEKNS